MSDEFPELPKRNSAAPAGPFALVNVEELEREIDEKFSQDVEYLARLQANSVIKTEAARLSGKIEGMKLQREKAIAALRRAAGGVR